MLYPVKRYLALASLSSVTMVACRRKADRVLTIMNTLFVCCCFSWAACCICRGVRLVECSVRSGLLLACFQFIGRSCWSIHQIPCAGTNQIFATLWQRHQELPNPTTEISSWFTKKKYKRIGTRTTINQFCCT